MKWGVSVIAVLAAVMVGGLVWRPKDAQDEQQRVTRVAHTTASPGTAGIARAHATDKSGREKRVRLIGASQNSFCSILHGRAPRGCGVWRRVSLECVCKARDGGTATGHRPASLPGVCGCLAVEVLCPSATSAGLSPSSVDASLGDGGITDNGRCQRRDCQDRDEGHYDLL